MFSEHGHDHSLMSWWPTDTVWQTNAQHTRWTEKADNWYVKRLEKIRQGQEGPFNSDRWRTEIRGSSKLRRINNSVANAFNRFVDSHVTA